MKTLLIIFLFIAVNGYSQSFAPIVDSIDYTRLVQPFHYHDEYCPRFDYSKPSTNKYKNLSLNMNEWLYYYDLYAKECFNDSTIEYNFMIEYWNGQKFDTLYSKELINLPECYITQRKTYMHKDPNNLTEFTNWLKKQ